MKKNNFAFGFLISLFFVVGAIPFSAIGEHQNGKTDQGMKAMIKDKFTVSRDELSELVLDSNEVLRRFVQSANPVIPEAQLNKAQCVAIFPQVTKGALLVGGEHGDGIASCKGAEGDWSEVAFLNITGASFGTQAGVKQTELALLFMNNEAEEKLKKGKVAIGADASYVFGEHKGGRATSTGEADVYAYANSSGAYVGASLEGTVVSADDSEMETFYGAKRTIVSALNTYPSEVQDASVRQFISLLP